MTNELTVQELWATAPAAEGTFDPKAYAHLPAGVRRYLEHAIAPGAPLARAVWARMHGEIKLRGWLPFTAEQVIVWGRGFIWQATVRMFGLPIRGSDRWADGQGAMNWKLLGLIPVMTADGPDITRSAAGRVAGEAVWLPSVFCGDGVTWTAADGARLQATLDAHGITADLELAIDEHGRLQSVQLPRWGNPQGDAFHQIDFGALVEEEKTFGGYTIPTRLRAGWYFGSNRFETEGEFFRATVDDVTYR
ncbi:MAG: hypothetical protein PVI68_22775, partial [Anaerolineae bacterium]